MPEIKLVKKAMFVLEDLHYQYIPQLVNLDIWNNDMSLPNSPHVELARILLEHGKDWSKIKNTRFVADRRYRYEKGLKKWTKEYIKKHIFESRYGILKSIKKYGYKEILSGKIQIAVLRNPIYCTRTNDKTILTNEIYHGGRRCSAAYVLGYKKLPGYWAKDAKPGTYKYKLWSFK